MLLNPQVEIAEPGSGYTEAGAKIAIDPAYVNQSRK